MIVGDHHGSRIDVLRIEANLAEIRSYKMCRQLFALSRNRVERARSDVTECRQRFREVSELIEDGTQFPCDIERVTIAAKKRFTFAEMSVAKCFHAAKSSDQMSLSRLLGNRQQ
jgi:ABC-type iron transport system FetAB ATPase subunit